MRALDAVKKIDSVVRRLPILPSADGKERCSFLQQASRIVLREVVQADR